VLRGNATELQDTVGQIRDGSGIDGNFEDGLALETGRRDQPHKRSDPLVPFADDFAAGRKIGVLFRREALGKFTPYAGT